MLRILALSTWTGSTNLSVLGTVTNGTWSAGTIAYSKGTGLTALVQLISYLGLIWCICIRIWGTPT